LLICKQRFFFNVF